MHIGRVRNQSSNNKPSDHNLYYTHLSSVGHSWALEIYSRSVYNFAFWTSSDKFVRLRAPRTQNKVRTLGHEQRTPLGYGLQPNASRPSSVVLEQAEEERNMRFTQVRATLRCKTLLLLCGGLASRWAEDELVQWKNNLRTCVLR